MNHKPAQLTLPIGVDETLSFENFIEGSNARLLEHLNDQLLIRLKKPDAAYYGAVLWGDTCVGKTHLLYALAQQFKQSGGEVCWLMPEQLQHDLSISVENKDLYIVDDLPSFMMNDVAERKLLTIVEQIKQAQSMLLLSARQAVSHLTIGLADLSSRIKAMDSFELKVLDDTQKREVIRQRAFQRGIILNNEVLAWLFSHTSRDLGVLLDLLEQMDVISLTQKRKVTIPLIKAILAEQ